MSVTSRNSRFSNNCLVVVILTGVVIVVEVVVAVVIGVDMISIVIEVKK